MFPITLGNKKKLMFSSNLHLQMQSYVHKENNVYYIQ